MYLQFGGQEPGTDEEISSFCSLNHGVDFPLMKKSDVNGDHTNEVYKWLKNQKAGILGLTRIKVCSPASLAMPLLTLTFQWNFEKFLVDKNLRLARQNRQAEQHHAEHAEGGEHH